MSESLMPFKKMGQKTIQSRYSNQIIQFFFSVLEIWHNFLSRIEFSNKNISLDIFKIILCIPLPEQIIEWIGDNRVDLYLGEFFVLSEISGVKYSMMYKLFILTRYFLFYFPKSCQEILPGNITMQKFLAKISNLTRIKKKIIKKIPSKNK